jgi:SAM-dependent methyltransferase
VLEHVDDDRQSVQAMLRALHKGGRLVVFVPNRGYPFETHGIFWGGRYHFGNIPLVNYLPRRLRDKLAPHVRAYSAADLQTLFDGFPCRPISTTTIFGAYDNIIARWPLAGRLLRTLLQGLEHTPLRGLGLSHFWVVEKV